MIKKLLRYWPYQRDISGKYALGEDKTIRMFEVKAEPSRYIGDDGCRWIGHTCQEASLEHPDGLDGEGDDRLFIKVPAPDLVSGAQGYSRCLLPR